MKRTLIAFAVAAALPLTALAQMGGPSAPGKSPSNSSSTSSGSGISSDSTLNRLDTNKDGYVSRSEAKGSAEISKNFKELDKDHDGKLSPSELSSSSGTGGSSDSGSSSASGGTSPGSGSSPKSKY